MWFRLLQFLASSAVITFLIRNSKKIILPGFERVPLYDVAIFFWKSISKGSITMRASAVAFSFFLAIFPSIIFMFTVIPYIPIENFQERLLSSFQHFMPHNAYEATKDTILDIVTNQRGGLLSIGFITALYFSTNGFNALITAFNNTYHDIETRKPIHQRLVSLLLVIITTVLILVSIALLIGSEYVLHKIFTHDDYEIAYHLIQIGRWVILFALFFCLISFTYYLGPSQKGRWKFISAGSITSTLLMVITSSGFAYYVDHFGKYNKLYGSIGTLIVILLWIYFNSLVILFGFDLNASIREARKNKEALESAVPE